MKEDLKLTIAAPDPLQHPEVLSREFFGLARELSSAAYSPRLDTIADVMDAIGDALLFGAITNDLLPYEREAVLYLFRTNPILSTSLNIKCVSEAQLDFYAWLFSGDDVLFPMIASQAQAIGLGEWRPTRKVYPLGAQTRRISGGKLTSYVDNRTGTQAQIPFWSASLLFRFNYERRIRWFDNNAGNTTSKVVAETIPKMSGRGMFREVTYGDGRVWIDALRDAFQEKVTAFREMKYVNTKAKQQAANGKGEEQ